MKNFKLILFAICFSTGLGAQQVFQKAFSAPFYPDIIPACISQTSNGGYTLGTTDLGILSEPNLVRLDAAGNLLSLNTIDNLTYPTLINFSESAGGGYYAFGSYMNQFQTSENFFLTMFDASMNILWTKEYPIYGPGYGYTKIKQFSDGSFIISESYYSKMGALRLDANGNINWHYSFTDDTSGAGKCPSFDCIATSDGGILFTGKRTEDICLVKVDGAGQAQWIKSFNSGSAYYHTRSVAEAPEGGFIMSGFCDYLPFLMKADANGNIIWYHAYNLMLNTGGTFEKILVLPSGEIMIMGLDYNSIVFIAKADGAGNILNAAALSEYDISGNYNIFQYPCMNMTSDGGIILAAYTYNYMPGAEGISLFKSDASLNFGCATYNYSISINQTIPAPVLNTNANVFRLNESLVSTSAQLSISGGLGFMADYCSIFSVNTTENNSASITAYPSPLVSGDELTIELSGYEGKATIGMYDINGRLTKEQQTVFNSANSKSIVSSADLSPGIYLVRITDISGNTLGTEKIIVR